MTKRRLVMDATDGEILDLLRKDGRMRIEDIARAVGMPGTTIHFRINYMKEAGIIKGFTVVTDLGAELRNVEGFVEVIEKMIAQQRKEVDMLWATMKGCIRRIEALEKGKVEFRTSNGV